MRALIIKTDGTFLVEKIEAGLCTKRRLVGGDIECITLDNAFRMQMIINEAGKIYNLPINADATTIFRSYFKTSDDYIAGDAIILGLNDQGFSCSLTNAQIKELKVRRLMPIWVYDPERLMSSENGMREGVYELLYRNEKLKVRFSAYIGEIGKNPDAPWYAAQNVQERLNQHLHRFLGGEYFTYWTGIGLEEKDWKIELHLLCEESDAKKRKEAETLFIEQHHPFLQDTVAGKFDLYPHEGYHFNDVALSPWTRKGETEGQRRLAFLYHVRSLTEQSERQGE